MNPILPRESGLVGKVGKAVCRRYERQVWGASRVARVVRFRTHHMGFNEKYIQYQCDGDVFALTMQKTSKEIREKSKARSVAAAGRAD
ncbi:hypothetical protein [Insolitispirillum peregrinum]|uniref:hypothetical protein n=1 Tax=Insolitispirillum peregrinum TaxID=80876 RepID=UPI001115764C|nr:hypothetical protein [Insolitispirillum peregrinum]